jgi:hypothetical protein
MDCDNRQIGEIVSGMPLLSSLQLTNLPQLSSLSFLLSSPTLAATLTDLQLCSCNSIPVSELIHVHALRALRSLRLHSSFTQPLDVSTRALYTPPSALLPSLAEFVCDAEVRWV